MKRMMAGLLVAAALVLVVAVPPAPAHAYSYAEWAIDIWSARYGVAPNYMVSVAQCESGLDPAAYNPSTGAVGLFQFVPSTFYWLRDDGLNQDPAYVPGDFYETRDVSDMGAQAHVAVWAFAHGYGYMWSCS
jgi:soluble lytic murein transglycosylase-like protein